MNAVRNSKEEVAAIVFRSLLQPQMSIVEYMQLEPDLREFMACVVLHRAIGLLITLTGNRVPVEFVANYSADKRYYLPQLTQVVSALFEANKPKQSGRKPKSLNYLGVMDKRSRANRRGRRQVVEDVNDAHLMRMYEAEKRRQPGPWNDYKIFRAIWLRAAKQYLPQIKGSQGLSALQLKEEEAIACSWSIGRVKQLRRIKERTRKARYRQRGTIHKE